MKESIKVLMITSAYPSAEKPTSVPFISRQVKFLRRAGVEVDVFHFKGKKKFFNYVAAWKRLRKHTAGKHYDLMHAQWGHSAALALPKKMPWVITFRGNDLEGIVNKKGKPRFIGKILQTVSKSMARLADEVIVVSRSLGEHLKRDDYHIIPSGLDFETFRLISQDEARKTLNLPADKKLILFASTEIENPRKRLELAKAAVEIVKNRFDAELVVATKIPHKTIPVYMNACDSLLLTSVHEGSPNVVKEALACNLPIVSVDVGDVRERIGDIEGCVVCENDSKETIAAAIEKVLIRGKRTNARHSVENLNEEITTGKVIEIYKNALRQEQIQNSILSNQADNKRSSSTPSRI